MPRKTQDTPISHQRKKLTIRDLREDIKPLTPNQTAFFQSYDQGDYFIALHGVAGTGKTFCALYKALREVLTKGTAFNKIIVVRSAVQGRDIGHLPGDTDEKLDIYQQPYRQICSILFNRHDAWDLLIADHRVEFISTSFIRGMSFDNAIILFDEVQNCTFEELDTVMTRLGYQSKILMCGDYRQTDLNKKKNDVSGLTKFFDVVKRMNAFSKFEFVIDDIVRSSIVKDYIVARTEYEDENSGSR